ncbi:MAG: glycosyltransferase, partial [Cyanobacteria bacterium P01_G01_bin.49]
QVKVADKSQNLEEIQEQRKQKLLNIFEQFNPDCLMTEGYPFNKHQFEFESIPLLERIKEQGGKTKVVCSLRDIVMAKHYQNRAEVTEKICQLMNQYFDLLLVHSDPKFHNLEESFAKVKEIKIPIRYTGYVAQSPPEYTEITEEDATNLKLKKPMILISVGGGQLGHNLLEAIIETSPIIEKLIPHHLHVFTGPFIPNDKFLQLRKASANLFNLTLRQYTPNLLSYMKKADISISLCGYNTTMNILKIGVNSMIIPSNKDWEQKIRAEKLEKLGLTELISSHDLTPHNFAQKIVANLHKKTNVNSIDLKGAEKTSLFLQKLLYSKVAA